MRFLILFVLIVASVNSYRLKNIEFPRGLSYIYNYKARVLIGIPKLSNQYSSSELICNLIVKSESDGFVSIKLNKIKLAHLNQEIPSGIEAEDINYIHKFDKDATKHLETVFRFSHLKGKVKLIEYESNEPIWSVNIKKSIASLFNLNLAPQKILTDRSLLDYKDFNELNYYGLYERDVNGICETIYELTQSPDPQDPTPKKEQVLNVTKTRNYHNCLTDSIEFNENYDIRGCPAFCGSSKSHTLDGYYPIPKMPYDVSPCPCKKFTKSTPLDQYNWIKYNISLAGQQATIESVKSHGRVSFVDGEGEIVTITHQEMNLNDILPSFSSHFLWKSNQKSIQEDNLKFKMPISFRYDKNSIEIPMNYIYDEFNQKVSVKVMVDIFDQIADRVVEGGERSSQEIMTAIPKLIKQIGLLSAGYHIDLFNKVAAYTGKFNASNLKEKIRRKLYLDALPLSGTNKAAMFIKKLIKNRMISEDEAEEVIAALPENMYQPNVEIIQTYFNLCKHSKSSKMFASSCIAFGKMVKKALEANCNSVPAKNYRYFEGFIKRSVPEFHENQAIEYVQELGKLFHKARNFKEKIIYIETMSHTALPQVLDILRPLITGHLSPMQCVGYSVEDSQECDYLRITTIYTLYHIVRSYPNEVQSLLLPIYRNPTEPYQLRIAAFSNIMFSNPSKQVLESIASELHRENNDQVRSYVVSSLRHTANIKIPYTSRPKKAAQEVIEFLPEIEEKYITSKLYFKDYFNSKSDSGHWIHSEYVANNESLIPKSGYIGIGQSSGRFQDSIFEAAFTQKGLGGFINDPKAVIETIINKGRSIISEKGIKLELGLDGKLDPLIKRMFYGEDEDLKATFYYKLFEKTGYYAFDLESFTKLINTFKRNIYKEMSRNYTGMFVKLLNPASLQITLPNEMGIPVTLNQFHPIIISLKIEIGRLVSGDELKLSAVIRPEILYSSISEMSVRQEKVFGTSVNKHTRIKLPLEMSFEISNKNLQMSCVPLNSTNILHHKTKTETFIKEPVVLSSDRDGSSIKEINTRVFTKNSEQKFFRMRLNVDFESENQEKLFKQSKYSSEYDLFQSLLQFLKNTGLKSREN